jgi:di/tricarboxylate transporter
MKLLDSGYLTGKIIHLIFVLVEKKLPWGVIILLGGGFALSDATEQ